MATIIRFGLRGRLSHHAPDAGLKCKECGREVYLRDAILIDMPKKWMQILCSVGCARAWLGPPDRETTDYWRKLYAEEKSR